MIVDVTSRHGRASHDRETPSYLTYRDHRRSALTGSPFASAGGSPSGYARQPPARAELLTLIDALFSPWSTLDSRRLTLPSSGPTTGYALRWPLMSNV